MVYLYPADTRSLLAEIWSLDNAGDAKKSFPENLLDALTTFSFAADSVSNVTYVAWCVIYPGHF